MITVAGEIVKGDPHHLTVAYTASLDDEIADYLRANRLL